MERIQVMVGSTRPARFGEKPGRWVAEQLAARADLDVELIDLRDYPLPFFEHDRPPGYTLREYPDEATARLGRKQLLGDDLKWWASALATARGGVPV
jgi:NAD(P)H-dependent FMN reductase